MASSLNRIFASKIYATTETFWEEDCDESQSEGSDTESVMEEDPEDSDCPEVEVQSRKRPQGVAPKLSSSDGKEKVQRNPTRRPNPKVFNRNALLARENRRRKKERLEQLEREVEDLRIDNGRIRKSLKKKDGLIRQLTQERNYLKSVIANRTGIMSVLRAIQGITTASGSCSPSMTSSMLNFVKTSGKAAEGRLEVATRRKGSPSSSDEGFGASPLYRTVTDEDEHLFARKNLTHAQSLSPSYRNEETRPSSPLFGMPVEEDRSNEEEPDCHNTIINGSTTVTSQQLPAYEDEFSRLPDVDELLATMADGSRNQNHSQVILSQVMLREPESEAFVSTSCPEDEFRWSSVRPVR